MEWRTRFFFSFRVAFLFFLSVIRSKPLPGQPGVATDRADRVEVHIYGLHFSKTPSLFLRLYAEPYTENSSIIIYNVHSHLLDLFARGITDVRFVFDNKSTQHAGHFIAYLYYMVVKLKALGPSGRIQVLYLHHVQSFSTSIWELLLMRFYFSL